MIFFRVILFGKNVTFKEYNFLKFYKTGRSRKGWSTWFKTGICVLVDQNCEKLLFTRLGWGFCHPSSAGIGDLARWWWRGFLKPWCFLVALGWEWVAPLSWFRPLPWAFPLGTGQASGRILWYVCWWNASCSFALRSKDTQKSSSSDLCGCEFLRHRRFWCIPTGYTLPFSFRQSWCWLALGAWHCLAGGCFLFPQLERCVTLQGNSLSFSFSLARMSPWKIPKVQSLLCPGMPAAALIAVSTPGSGVSVWMRGFLALSPDRDSDGNSSRKFVVLALSLQVLLDFRFSRVFSMIGTNIFVTSGSVVVWDASLIICIPSAWSLAPLMNIFIPSMKNWWL